MLCIIYNEEKDRLLWKFGVCPKELRNWAKIVKREGDEVKYLNGVDENSMPQKSWADKVFKYISFGQG